MKKVIAIAGVTAILLSGCSTLKKSRYNDDVYADPKEEKLEREKLAREQKKKAEEEAKKQAEELAAQKAKDDANPAYKTPSYSKDDYYDYEYASRIRRFNNPVYGLGYYDNYYTNYYWYNHNPAYYGTSIYTSYNWWGPSYYMGYGSNYGPSYGCGMNYNWGYGYPNYGYGYNPYGYGYNPYWSGYYNGYNHGYYNGWYGYPYGGGYSPYYNGWGYFNSYDNNSGYSTYAPRTSHDGGNSGRMSNPGVNASGDLTGKYIQSVLSQQESAPKFHPDAQPVKPIKTFDHSNQMSPSNMDGMPTEPRHNPDIYNNPKGNINQNSGDPQFNTNPIKISPKDNMNQNTNDPQFNNQPPIKTNDGPQPIKPIKTENPKNNFFESGSQPNFNRGYSSPAPSGGSSPRSGGGGGSSSRPR